MPDILLVEDKESLRRVLRLTLEHAGYSVTEAADAREASNQITRVPHKIVLTDLRMPNGSGLDVLRAAKNADSAVPVIVMTAYGSIDEAVQAMKDGAHDFLQKPVDSNHLLLLVERALEQSRLRTENILLREEWSKHYGFPRILGESEAIKRAVGETQRVAQTEATVLLLGESGTGKELFARAVHHLSNRRDKPFVAINCAAIPETLIENELFGHERGAFTGAGDRRLGKFELASTGTVFLDEIGDLDLAVQPKLLKVLEEKRFRRVGDVRERTVDVRFLAAANQDLDQRAEEKSFRQDLLYRINTVTLNVPALRDRVEDIPVLASAILEALARDMPYGKRTLTPAAVRALQDHTWPGNVRELRNALEHAVLLTDGATIDADAVGLRRRSSLSSSTTVAASNDQTLRASEIQEITRALQAEGGRVEKAAERLGVPRSSLYQKIRKYGISVPKN